MANWTLDDIHWDKFDPARVDPALLRLAKAASVVEHNVGAYVTYMANVFGDDPDISDLLDTWHDDELRHGKALGRWAELADPSFDFSASARHFAENYSPPQDMIVSVRGSRAGELIARCAVEAGTSSHYWAVGDSAEEPVLKQICKLIARDEVGHYREFRNRVGRFAAVEGVGFWRRLAVAAGRIAESDDDELSFAYYSANGDGGGYRAKEALRAYIADSYPRYRHDHIERALAMVFLAVDLKPNGPLHRTTARLAHGFMRYRGRRCAAQLAA